MLDEQLWLCIVCSDSCKYWSHEHLYIIRIFWLPAPALDRMEDSALIMEPCHFPTAAPGVITCPIPLTNVNCGVVNNTTLPDFFNCLPSPSCVPQNLNFTLHFFYRCNNDPSAVCGSACVRASQPWIMFVEGRTLEMKHLHLLRQSAEEILFWFQEIQSME